MFVIVLLVVFSVCIATGGGSVEVTFTSSPHPSIIAEGDTAVFYCSSDHPTVLITWLLNNISASTLNFTSLGVIANGGGTTSSSLTIPGLVDPFNDTEVQCVAFGFGIGDFSPSSVTLKVQGVPAPVDNLTLSYDSCCYTFSWIAPFTLPGFPILNYNISITNNGMIIDQTNVSMTQSTYCPPETGTHTISIAAVNEVGEGKINYHEFVVEETEIRETKPMDRYIDFYQNQIISVKLDGNEKLSAKLKNCIIELIELKSTDDSNTIFNSSNITDDGLVTFNISDQSAADKFHNVTTQITLDSGLVVHSNSSNPLSLSFFDVSGYEVLSKVSTNVSFQCTFLNGSKAAGCCIFMEEMKTGKNYSLDITRLTRENITATGHVEDFVESGSYDVVIYDINFDGNQASNPAYSTTIVVASSTPTPTAGSSPPVITSPTSMLPASPTSTTGEASNDNGGVIAIVIGSIFGIIFFGIILIVLVAFVCWKHKTHSKEFEISKRASQDVSNVEPKNTVNYVDVEQPGSNAPANPPPLEISKTVYSTILPANNQAQHDEEYSRLNHTSIQESSQGPSDYSTLEGQQDQTGSMLYDTVTDRPIQGMSVDQSMNWNVKLLTCDETSPSLAPPPSSLNTSSPSIVTTDLPSPDSQSDTGLILRDNNNLSVQPQAKRSSLRPTPVLSAWAAVNQFNQLASLPVADELSPPPSYESALNIATESFDRPQSVIILSRLNVSSEATPPLSARPIDGSEYAQLDFPSSPLPPPPPLYNDENCWYNPRPVVTMVNNPPVINGVQYSTVYTTNNLRTGFN
ncbi:PREDICTED: uncharacterized protein LOC109583730 [Amphimedon queenslandica]|uniref:Ig-like domain-containing protein n=2 Tax=Amphimedon queenslandica TaxID=400682 RepID=A0AAN0JCL4_AMPQE|nr:PREDICTED: uncharacterized protein LOC109583730 [Amphimedon queenslandica]|eukprot:XP_019854734.1 PREDICTED: uncharacterized protein LOC109583730 [Amphimedon queenslandica]